MQYFISLSDVMSCDRINNAACSLILRDDCQTRKDTKNFIVKKLIKSERIFETLTFDLKLINACASRITFYIYVLLSFFQSQ